MTKIIKQPEAESRLSKQLLGNFQTESSIDHRLLEAEVKNGVAYKKKYIAIMEVNRIYY